VSIPSYSSPFALGHIGAREIFEGPVVVDEKVDGSQFSMALLPDDCLDKWHLHCRSKGAVVHVDAPEGMFAKAVETAKSLCYDLTPGWVYRCEYLQKPKHNSLAYDRVPEKHLIVFDIDRGGCDYLTPDERRAEAGRLGLESVPVLYEGVITSAEQFKALLPSVSILGGQPAEGIVAKNYAQFTPDRKVMMVKYVTEAFKEVHRAEWKKTSPTHADVIETLIQSYRTPARWQKAVQHLREADTLTQSPKDSGLLMQECGQDVLKECEDEIKARLFAWAWPKIQRGVTAGLPEWYKAQLLDALFAKDVEAQVAAP